MRMLLGPLFESWDVIIDRFINYFIFIAVVMTIIGILAGVQYLFFKKK